MRADTTAQDFIATKNAAPTYSLSGTVTGAVLQNILITLNNGDTTSTNASGVYGFPALLAASYTVTPSKLGYTFSPASATVAVSALTTVPDFIATGKLNDTGITNMQCYQAASAVLGTCTATAATALNATQDGMVGRDVTVADPSDGKLGFSFTKICNNGELAGSTNCSINPNAGYGLTDWGCTQDNVTGLMWEIKTNDVTNPGLRDWSKRYTNYSATYDSVLPTYNTGSDATGFMTAVNNAGLCGHKDWRLPTADELQSIVDYGATAPAIPTVDTIWFPSTQARYFWSSSPYVGYPASAWGVNFFNGDVGGNDRLSSLYVRLVRAGQ